MLNASRRVTDLAIGRHQISEGKLSTPLVRITLLCRHLLWKEARAGEREVVKWKKGPRREIVWFGKVEKKMKYLQLKRFGSKCWKKSSITEKGDKHLPEHRKADNHKIVWWQQIVYKVASLALSTMLNEQICFHPHQYNWIECNDSLGS